MEGETYKVVLDDPQSSDVNLLKKQILVSGAPPIPFLGILNDPGERSSQAEQLKQVDFNPSVQNNTEYAITFVQGAKQEFREKTYSYTSTSSAGAQAIVDDLVSKINADNYLRLTASRQNSGATSQLRVTAESGYPDYDFYLNDSSLWSTTTNTNAQYPLGQGDQLIADGLDATSGNNYALWYFESVNPLKGKYADPNNRLDQWYIYANEGGASFSAFQTEINDYIQGYDGTGTTTISNQAFAPN